MTELVIKTERLREIMEANGLGGVLLNSQHNFAWLTGGGSNTVNRSIENGSGTIFIRRDGKRFVLASNIEIERLVDEELSARDFEPVSFDWRDEKASPDIAVTTARRIVPSGDLISDLPLGAGARPAEGIIAPCRFSLTDEEIGRYVALGADATEVVERAFGTLSPGMSEMEIASAVGGELITRGIEPVVLLVGSDERLLRFRHPVPTSKVWNKSLMVAICGKRNGLIASVSKVGCAGKIPDELKRRTDAAVNVLDTAFAATTVGESGSGLYEAIAAAYLRNGFADEIGNHHQGGAAGYKSRDWVAHPASRETVQANQAFAWNPTIAGTKAEQTAIVGPDGTIPVTKADTEIYQF